MTNFTVTNGATLRRISIALIEHFDPEDLGLTRDIQLTGEIFLSFTVEETPVPVQMRITGFSWEDKREGVCFLVGFTICGKPCECLYNTRTKKGWIRVGK